MTIGKLVAVWFAVFAIFMVSGLPAAIIFGKEGVLVLGLAMLCMVLLTGAGCFFFLAYQFWNEK